LSRIEEASKSITRIQTTLDRVLELTDTNLPKKDPSLYALERYKEFLDALGDDLNSPKAIGSLFDFVKDINHAIDLGKMSPSDAEDTVNYFYKINLFLGILHFENPKSIGDEEIDSLINQRIEARKNKDFKTSDEIRDILLKKGIIIEDTKSGIKWKRK